VKFVKQALVKTVAILRRSMDLNPKGRSTRMHFGIFIVFFFLFKKEQIPIKVSKYLKVPYAYNSLDLLRMQCKPYKRAHDNLYYVKAYHWITYFYCKNDLITYDRKSNYEVTIFTYDFLNGSYKAVKLSKLEGVLKDEYVFLLASMIKYDLLFLAIPS